MGGQACVLYGAAEFSRDLDFGIGALSELVAGQVQCDQQCPFESLHCLW